jgi:hypothetical protein
LTDFENSCIESCHFIVKSYFQSLKGQTNNSCKIVILQKQIGKELKYFCILVEDITLLYTFFTLQLSTTIKNVLKKIAIEILNDIFHQKSIEICHGWVAKVQPRFRDFAQLEGLEQSCNVIGDL